MLGVERDRGRRGRMVAIDMPAAAPPIPPAVAAGRARRPVLIAIPFYKNEALVESVVGSLIACAGELAELGAEAVFYNDSPDYPALAAALEAMLPRAGAAFPCRVVSNDVNLGFVRTMNRAIAEAVERRFDLLLLNSDTMVVPGAIAEMARVATLDPMVGFVNPRSNNATLTTLAVPPRLLEAAPERAADAFAALAARLPEFSYTPTGVGFCLLIDWAILAEFGGFDEIYGHGYNEENDLVMRAGRCGYRVAMANRAFVWHESERSFGSSGLTKSDWEPINRKILDTRYQEYGGFTTAYFDSPEVHAERLLGQLTPDAAGRLDLAFDFSTFAPIHNGTYQAGRQLLKAAVAAWADRFNIHVLCIEEVYAFHDYAALGVPRCDPHGPEKFAAIFRVGQPYDWNTIQRLMMKGAAIGIYMLDTISIDCTQLTSPALFNMWQFAMEHVDLVVALSRQTGAQLNRRFRIPATTVQACALLSTEIDDYRLAPTTGPHDPSGGTLLVLGNHFPHKYLASTANALAEAFPARAVVALGEVKPEKPVTLGRYEPQKLKDLANLAGVKVGKLGDDEMAGFYADAAAIVFPTHYEGFGIPVLNALAARRPLYVRRLPVFEELWESLGRNPNIHFFETTADLIEQMRAVAAWIDVAPAARDGADRVVRDIRIGLEAALARVDYQRIVDRVRGAQFPAQVAAGPARAPTPDEPAAFAARFLAERVERAALRLFDRPLPFAIARGIGRALRAGVRSIKQIFSWMR